jgi:hypothetical protein
MVIESPNEGVAGNETTNEPAIVSAIIRSPTFAV